MPIINASGPAYERLRKIRAQRKDKLGREVTFSEALEIVLDAYDREQEGAKCG
jgi:hypothetical protein